MSEFDGADSDNSDFKDSSSDAISDLEDDKKELIDRERAQKVINEIRTGYPDPDLNNKECHQILLKLHTDRLDRYIKENLDSSSIWQFLFLSADIHQSINAARSVQIKLAADPKQKEKILVRECWDEWQKQTERYKGKAAFARDMLSKFESLENHRVIERWCKEWESVLF